MTRGPELAPLKEIQKFAWGQGGPAELEPHLMPVADALAEACAVGPGTQGVPPCRQPQPPGTMAANSDQSEGVDLQ